MYTSPEGPRPAVNDYAALLRLRPELFPEFLQHQNGAVQAVADILLTHLHDERVEMILDVGCGTGEMLRAIEARIAERRERGPYATGMPKMIGIDSCAAAIQQALDGQSTSCQFKQFAAEHLVNIEDELGLGAVNWDKTFVMSVGHSLPHFEWLPFLGFIQKKQPRFVLIDFYKNWDYAIEHMKHAGLDEPVLEPRHVAKDGSAYLLYTKNAGDEHVMRGIQLKSAGMARTVFSTRQYAQRSSWFLEQFQRSHYLLEKELSYRAGYGEMNGYFMARASSAAEKINDYYFDAVSKVVRETFAKRHIKSAMELLHTRVAAVIMPFDRHLPFARYVPIFEGVHEAPKTPMLIADANTVHSQYPTAHGLYMALLDTVSSAAIVPLPELKTARSTQRDRDFKEQEEDDFFEKSTPKNDDKMRGAHDSQVRKIEDEDVYFVVPFYFSDLPLFCLITNFGPRLPVATTDQNVYISVLQNVARLVQQELHDDLIEKQILWPFVEASIHHLRGELGSSTEDAEHRLEELATDARSLPWKSWLVTIPSTPIRRLALIKRQEELFKRMWTRCVSAASSNMINRLSDWFRAAEFFTDEDQVGHAGYNHHLHARRARDLKQSAKIECFDDLPSAPLLRGTRTDPSAELIWASEQLHVLDESPDDSDREFAFLALKAVFCRELANKGSQYRFSLMRMVMLTAMYISDRQFETIRILALGRKPSSVREFAWTFLDSRRCVENDRTMTLMDLMKCFRASTIDSIEFILSELTDFTIVIKLKEPYEPFFHRGADYSGFDTAVREIDPRLRIEEPFTRVELHFALAKTNLGWHWLNHEGAIAQVVLQ